MPLSWSDAARLVRRTGFGATGSDVDAVVAEGAEAYVDRILAADPVSDPGAVSTPAPELTVPEPPGKKEGQAAVAQFHQQLAAADAALLPWWLRRVAAVEQPFGERLAFAWHSHFATSELKVRAPQAMVNQLQTQRTQGRGDFHTLAYSMLTDPAMLIWLDGQQNTVKGPNENLAREFMELFTLGHDDGYTQQDVTQGARALTGLKVRDGVTVMDAKLHDDGMKTLFGTTADYDPAGYCAAVLSRPGSPAFVAGSLWTLLASDSTPPASLLSAMTSAYGAQRTIGAALRAMYLDPAFSRAEGTKVTYPVDWAVGLVRALKVPMTEPTSAKAVTGLLRTLGQLPFYPSSVGGWPNGPVWLSTAAADVRFRGAAQLAKRAQLPELTGSTTARLETVAHLLGIASWSDGSLSALRGSASTPEQLVAVAANTPEYLIH